MDDRGNRIDYPGITYTPNTDITTTRLLFNSVISTKSANVYLNTPMARHEYMQISIKMIPQEMIDEYNITHLIENVFILAEIRK